VQRRFLDRGPFADGGGAPPPVRPPGVGGESDVFYVARLDSAGNVLAEVTPTLREGNEPPPDLPRLTAAAVQQREGRPFTVSARGGGFDYRVLVTPTADGSVVTAISLRELHSTVRRLEVIEVVATAAVLALLGILGFWVVRVGLRPLAEMGATADAIAAGDLSRRVEPTDERTEVGRLGVALNEMLGQIEAAFDERRESEDRLRRFVADASHELRTPLTSIRGYAELFRRGAAANPRDLATAMRRIEEEAARMGVLVDDLLLLARLDQGRPLERDPVDLVTVVEDAVHDARAVEPDRPIGFEPDGPLVVAGDDARLRQVVANLLGNVRVHTPTDTPVEVRLARDDGHAVLEVADEGPGLPQDAAAHAFERFYRADPSRARGSGGVGLGLSIVDAIARAHGGRAEVESAPGRGATVRVVLPLAEPGATSV
jgi:two-component system OmpR family sensor kinase